MAEVRADSVEDTAVDEAVEAPSQPVRRLCNEIQLFDLCDLGTCRFKDGRYCTEPGLLSRFEAIAEEELRPAARDVMSGEPDDGEAEDDDFDDVFDEDVFDDESYEEDE